AAAGAGYSTNIFPTSLDALFAGITTSVMGALPGFEFTPVNPVSNWFFNIASSIILGFVAGFVIDRLVEHRIVRMGNSRDEMPVCGEAFDPTEPDDMRARLSPADNRGLLVVALSSAVLTAAFLYAVLIPGSRWRNEDGGFLPTSPLLS